MSHLYSGIVVLLLYATPLAEVAQASSLDDFERSATRKSDEDDSSSSSSDRDPANGFLDFLLSGSGSKGDELDYDDDPATPESQAEPWFQLGYHLGNVSSDVAMEDLRFRAGYGSNGIFAQSTRLREQAPFTRLDAEQIIFLYHAAGPRGALELGAGPYWLRGKEDNRASALHLGLILDDESGFGGEYRWTSAHGDEIYLDDHQLLLRYRWRHASVNVGYRLLKAPDHELHGPFGGLSLHY